MPLQKGRGQERKLDNRKVNKLEMLPSFTCVYLLMKFRGDGKGLPPLSNEMSRDGMG